MLARTVLMLIPAPGSHRATGRRETKTDAPYYLLHRVATLVQRYDAPAPARARVRDWQALRASGGNLAELEKPVVYRAWVGRHTE